MLYLGEVHKSKVLVLLQQVKQGITEALDSCLDTVDLCLEVPQLVLQFCLESVGSMELLEGLINLGEHLEIRVDGDNVIIMLDTAGKHKLHCDYCHI